MIATSQIDRIDGPVLAMRGDDIDTDRILPARFLKAITFHGIETHLFEDDRLEVRARGALHPFDQPGAREARVLLVNANFGCGSSREHAPQAIQRWAIRAIVGESFADIFFANALAIGLPCLTVGHESALEIMRHAEEHPGAVAHVEIGNEVVVMGSIQAVAQMPTSARDALTTGQWDATAFLLADPGDIDRVAAGLPYVRGF